MTYGKPHAAVVTVVLPLTLWQRIRLLFGASCAARVGITTARYPGTVKLGADVLVGGAVQKRLPTTKLNVA